jgi:sulfoacetaldehyde dehydrogenase
MEKISEDLLIIDKLVERAQMAQQKYESNGSQKKFDTASQAVAWALMEPTNNRLLSELAVSETGLGNVEDKVMKNHNKTLGLMRDLLQQKTFGHISDEPSKGLSTYLRPKGVIAAIIPSTNPIATPTNNIINSIKTGNAIILAPSPKGAKPLSELLKKIYLQLNKIGMDPNLVQMIPNPPSKLKTERLMQLADLVIVTGSRSNVHAGYSSGTPAIGVGVGNVVTIVDETADIKDASEKIAKSKVFDNATSCSSENSIVAVEGVYKELIECLSNEGGMLLNSKQTTLLEQTHWQKGKMTSTLLAKDMPRILSELNLEESAPTDCKFLIVPQSKTGSDHPLSGEKMARFISIYKVADFKSALDKAIEIQNYQGAGHSIGIHTSQDRRSHRIALLAKTCRVIVNQAHCFATGGFFNNGSPFSLSMGCGSWGGNSIDDNLNWEHFVNRVKIVRIIPQNKPKLSEIFSDYWKIYGK